MAATSLDLPSTRTGSGPGRSGEAVVTGAAHALPAARDQEQLWDGFFAEHFGHNRWARTVFSSTGVRRRHPAIDPTVEDVSGWSTGARMQRYLVEAVPLGRRAVADALHVAGLPAGDVGLFAVVSCTGYATPGIDIHLARDLGMADVTQRLLIGHMGCYAALPALGAVRDYVVARRRPAVLLCVELSSLHVQPGPAELDQVVAHSLFSDAACALVVEPSEAARPTAGNPGLGRPRRPTTAAAGGIHLSVLDVAARTDPTTAEHMTWGVTDFGFRMGLSRQVPDVLARHVRPVVERLLADNEVRLEDVAAWAVHPGGPRILDVVAKQLGLADDALDASRHVLAEHGNSSSATVLLVLDELAARGGMPPDSYAVALAFGPGLTLYAALLRA